MPVPKKVVRTRSGDQLVRGSGVSNLEMDTARTDRSPRRARAGWAWLAGGDGFVLATVPSEVSFLNGLGMWVAGMALVSGFAMTVAASQWWSTSIASVRGCCRSGPSSTA